MSERNNNKTKLEKYCKNETILQHMTLVCYFIQGSREYRAELTSRITRKPASRHDMPPQYAKIKEDTRSHNCIECDKLCYEIERLQMKLDEKSSRGSRLAMLDSKESSRSGDYKHNTDW